MRCPQCDLDSPDEMKFCGECVHTGLAGWQATGAEVALPHFFALQAEIRGRDEHVGEGLTLLDEALSVVEKNGERYYEAELYRMKGEFLIQQAKVASLQPPAPSPQAEEYFLKAIEIAQEQKAKFWELRAAKSLGRLWHEQGRGVEARPMIQEIHDWFTEGFGTADLQEAKTLLDTLA